MLHAPGMELRYYNPKSSKPAEPVQVIAPRSKRQTANPYRTEDGSAHSYQHKLKAAAVCTEHSIRRMVPLNCLPKYRDITNPQLFCKLCLSRGIKKRTSWACNSCGCELCIRVCTTGKNKYPNIISCADAAHQQDKINITNLTIMK